jgi:ArsR family transcriptional regulator, arsenate/arsenite/antimonite-responsive transcriptional repressor
MEVWRMLLEQGPLGLPAGAIAARLAVAPSSLSFHLQQMTQGGVLLQHRSSRQIIYMVNNEVIGALCDLLIGGGMIPIVPPALTNGESGDILGQR